MYSPLQATRLYEQIVDQIEGRIAEGTLKPGDQLAPERELCQQFGVSRTVVREAVKALREKGLVEVQPGRGTYITRDTAEMMRQSLGLMVKIDGISGLTNLMQVRAILEPEIAALAAEMRTRDDIERMGQAIEKMDGALHDVDCYIKADEDFHLALARATQNDLILKLMNPIVDLLCEHRKRVFNAGRGGPQHAQVHHREILATIADGDRPAARRAMIAHLEQVRIDSGMS